MARTVPMEPPPSSPSFRTATAPSSRRRIPGRHHREGVRRAGRAGHPWQEGQERQERQDRQARALSRKRALHRAPPLRRSTAGPLHIASQSNEGGTMAAPEGRQRCTGYEHAIAAQSHRLPILDQRQGIAAATAGAGTWLAVRSFALRPLARRRGLRAGWAVYDTPPCVRLDHWAEGGGKRQVES